MSSFELQTFKNGEWSVDSYYDDRELALSEAERLQIGGRHAGIRVLEEEYHEPTNTSNYQVIFSKMANDAAKKDNWRVKTKRDSRPASDTRKNPRDPRGAKRSPPTRKSGGGSLTMPVVAAVVLLVIGVGAMFALQSDLNIQAMFGAK